MAAVGALAQPVVQAIDIPPTSQTFCDRVWEKFSDAWTGIKDVAHRTWVAVRDFFVAKYEWVKEKWNGKPVEVITPQPAPPPVQEQAPAQEVLVVERRAEQEAPVEAAPPPVQEQRLEQEVQAPHQQQALLAEFVPYPDGEPVHVEALQQQAAPQGPQEVPPPGGQGGGNCEIM